MNSDAPPVWTLLVRGDDREPLNDIWFNRVNADHAQVKQRNATIGLTQGIGPDPAGRLDIQFTAGNLPGDYVTTITLNNGNSISMVVTAE